MEEEYKKGNIVIQDSKIERRQYFKDYKGIPLGNLWSDIANVRGGRKHRLSNTETVHWQRLELVADPDRAYQMEYKKETPLFREIEKHIHSKFENNHEWVKADLKNIIAAITKQNLYCPYRK